MAESPRLPWRVVAASTVLALLAAAATVVLLSPGSDEADPSDTTSDLTDGSISLVPPEDVPTFDEARLQPLDGGDELPLSSVRGKPTVINFFASTCTPCITEMPAFEEVYQDLGGASADVAFLGVTISTDRTEDALHLVDRTGVTYATAKDVDNTVVGALDVALLPSTVLLDAEGRVVGDVHAGALTAGELRELLADELGIQP